MGAAVTIAKFFVDGLPESKGSWVSLPNGKMRRDNPREKAWATAVGWAAKVPMIGKKPYDGHVAVELDFLLPPPHGRKHRRDADKLARSVLDAMTGIVYVDDELVYKLLAVKNITNSGMHGVQVTVRRAERIEYRCVTMEG